MAARAARARGRRGAAAAARGGAVAPPTLPADPRVPVAPDLAALAGLSITNLYSSDIALQVMLQTIGVQGRERTRLFRDGFATIQDVVNHFSDDMKSLKRHLETTNKAFATAPVDPVYFTPPVINNVLGAFHYFNIGVNGMHTIPDPLGIDRTLASDYGKHFKLTYATAEDDDENAEDLTIPSFTGATDWVAFRDAFVSKLSSTRGARGFPLSYVINTTPRNITRRNAALLETDSIDLEDDTLIDSSITHFGPGFKLDNQAVWTRLRSHLLNTPPYNHISEYNNTKNGRAAWLALKEFFEGEDFQQRMQDAAFSILNTTFYKGETNRYSFEKYINSHKQAHKMLDDCGYNGGRGMDEATKMQHFKAHIRAEAGLESSLSAIRATAARYNTFTQLASFLTAEVDQRKLRKAQLKSVTRNVSGVGKNPGKGKGKGKGKDRKKEAPSEVVEGKRVYGQHYNDAEFRRLSQAQRNAVIRMRRELRSRNGTNGGNGSRNGRNADDGPARNISDLSVQLQDTMSQMEDRIMAGVARGSQEQTDDQPQDQSGEDQSNSSGSRRRSTPSGGVGGFFANQRRRHN